MKKLLLVLSLTLIPNAFGAEEGDDTGIITIGSTTFKVPALVAARIRQLEAENRQLQRPGSRLGTNRQPSPETTTKRHSVSPLLKAATTGSSPDEVVSLENRAVRAEENARRLLETIERLTKENSELHLALLAAKGAANASRSAPNPFGAIGSERKLAASANQRGGGAQGSLLRRAGSAPVFSALPTAPREEEEEEEEADES